jgi:glyoxylase-like metal-dependent hydrolase (beta-lactamase superfamily II)
MRAEEFQIVSPSLAVWQAYEPAVKCDLSSCARRFGKELVLIDPIPLAKAALAELIEEATPTAIVLTNGNHARAAADFRDRFSIPILAHAAAESELGLAVDQPLLEGELALGHFTVIEIAGAPAGEIALHADGIVHVGDALIHLEPMGFTTLPEKYCADPREMRRALGKLLRFDFEVLTFAHGLPLVSQARRRLAHLLA